MNGGGCNPFFERFDPSTALQQSKGRSKMRRTSELTIREVAIRKVRRLFDDVKSRETMRDAFDEMSEEEREDMFQDWIRIVECWMDSVDD